MEMQIDREEYCGLMGGAGCFLRHPRISNNYDVQPACSLTILRRPWPSPIECRETAPPYRSLANMRHILVQLLDLTIAQTRDSGGLYNSCGRFAYIFP